MNKYSLILLFLIYTQLGFTQVFIVETSAIDTMVQLKDTKPIEANFLFSYYEQDGTKSPVTGGIGDEALTDMVGEISLNIPINPKIDFNFSGGVDVYSSASTDNINNEHGLYTETSASVRDARAHGNIGVQINNDKTRFNYGLGIGGSREFDVMSYNYNAFINKTSKNLNTQIYLKGSVYTDYWTLIYPSELRGNRSELLVDDVRNSYNGLLSITQDISPKLNGSFTFETTFQKGLLSTPFHRVYFKDSNIHSIERLPDNKIKFPMGFRLNYYINKYLIVKLYYRYYFDDFDVNAHTASVELPIKPFNSFAVIPFYRYHTQTASKYFQPYGVHSIHEEFYTSDYDLSNVKSNRVGLELRYSLSSIPKNEKKGMRVSLKKITLRGSKYYRERESELILKSYIMALQLSFRIE